MNQTIMATGDGAGRTGCAGDRLIYKSLTQDTYTKEQVAEIIADCAELAEARKPDLSGLCAGYRPPSAIAGGSTSSGYHGDPSYAPDTPSRPAGGSCTGLCSIQRFQAAKALDRKFNVNAGVQGWFGPSPGTPCTGLCSIQRFNAAKALDRKFNTNAGVNGWFGQNR